MASPAEVVTWGNNVTKLTSVKHRNMLLKVAHGDVYTNLKKFKFRMNDTPRCQQCGQIETLTHKILDCGYAAQIWRHVLRLTESIRLTNSPNEDISNKIMGMVSGTNVYLLTIHAEILTRIHYLQHNPDFTLHPKIMVRQSLNYLLKREKSEHFKNILNDLLAQI